MTQISVRLEKSGRILLPAYIRRRLGLKEGESEVLLNVDDTSVSVTTRKQAVARVQQWASAYVAPGQLVSEDLSVARRNEAEQDFAD